MKGKKKNVTTKKSANPTSTSKRTTKTRTKKVSKPTRKVTDASTSRKGVKPVKKTKGTTRYARKKQLSTKEQNLLAQQLRADLEREFKESEREESEVDQLFYEEFVKQSKAFTNYNKVKKYSKRIKSIIFEKRYDIRNYQITFNDIIEFETLKSLDSNEIFDEVEPYFSKIFSRIRKHPIYYALKFNLIVENFDLKSKKLKDTNFDSVSRPKKDIEVMPDEFYGELRNLSEDLVKWVSQYEKRGVRVSLIGGEFQVYDKEYELKQTTKKKGKKKK